MPHFFSLQIMLLLLLAGLSLALAEGAAAQPSNSRVRSLPFWISIALCGIAGGLVGGLLNMGAYALGRRAFGQTR